jgi:ADP-ribosyl-[dinitrogen reductase] hydrolase
MMRLRQPVKMPVGLTMKSDRSDRIRGALLGLLAGDKIGGPSHMALELAESLLVAGQFDPVDVVGRYKAWYDRDGFDTGQVATMVFRKMETMNNKDAVKDVDDYLGGLTAGCNPVHRALPIALVPFIDDLSLFRIAETEARLTHHHRLAGEVSGTFLAIVREFISGREVGALQTAMTHTSAELQRLLFEQKDSNYFSGGYAPEVLRATMYFTDKAQSFDEALDSAVMFAGPENYSPVLVGAMAGARWGYRAIDQRHLSCCSRQLIDRAERLGMQMSDAWSFS